MPNQEDFKIDSPEQEPELEIKPEYSEETLNNLLQIDLMMEEDEKLLNGLGGVERKRIEDNKEDNKEAYKEIYARVEIGRVSLKGKQDTGMLEVGGMGLRARNFIRKIVSGGKKGSEYVLKNESGALVDKRKLLGLSDSYIKAEHPLENVEIAAAAEELGLDIGEALRRDLSKKYAKGEKGAKVEKIIMGQKTDQEKDKIAGDILEGRLKDSEKTGADMVKQREGLAAMQRDMVKFEGDLDDNAKKKLDDEKEKIETSIKDKQAELNEKLEPIRTPMEKRQAELATGLEGLSVMSKDLTAEEEKYKNEIKILDDKIKRIKGSEKIKDFMGEEIGKWEKEKAKLEANKQAFANKKKELEIMAKALKSNKDEIDKTLARINKIGKTKEELKAEEAEKQRAEKEEKEKKQKEQEGESTKEPAKAGSGLLYDADLFNEKDEKEAEEASKKGNDMRKNWEEDVDEERKEAEAEDGEKAALEYLKNIVFKKKTAAPKVKAENKPSTTTVETGQQKKEKTLSHSAEGWVALLPQLLNLSLNDEQKGKIKNYFVNAKGVYAPAAVINEKQAVSNMSNFLKSEIYKKGKKTKDQIEQELTDKIKLHKKVNK
ncbi:MAG: hypothetical protein Q7R92_05265 [bacterium]|nr:hypothetical protein [bacterium]